MRNGWPRARRGRSASASHADSPRSIHDRRLRLESLEDRRLLAVFMVTNLNNTGGGSLRSAVALANDAGSVDTIRFADGLSGGTISLTSGEIEITDALTIDAAPLAANMTIDAGGLSRIFNITVAAHNYTFTGLNLTGGRSATGGSGGAIRSLTPGLLTLRDCTVSGSSTTADFAAGGGIFAYRAVTLIQSTVSGNSSAGDGGGVYSGGVLTLTQSTVSGNSTTGDSSEGGGMRAGGGVTLTQSTVSDNSTAGVGSEGGGIFTLGGVTLTQSTVSGNSTLGESADGGGIYAYRDAVTLTQSTITNNRTLHPTAFGGGLFQGRTDSNFPLSISGSILAGNFAAAGSDDLSKDPQSSLTVNYSVIGTGVVPTAGGNNASTNFPQLGPLVNNGGTIQTHAVLAASPARNAGDPSIAFSPSEFDQRGAPFVRVAAGRIDAGAYERQTLAGPFIVDIATDEFDGNYSAGELSLREAINATNGSIGAETITYAPGLSGQVITLGGRELDITESLTIDARPLAANVTINANQLSRIFNITATSGDFTLGGLTLTGGRTTATDARGGAIRSGLGTLTLNESTVSGNSTVGNGAVGGGIATAGAVALIQSFVSGNSTAASDANGGGIFADGTVTLNQSTVSGNSTLGNSADGGGIYGGFAMLTQSTVSGNSTMSGNGGGVWTRYSVALTRSTITGNHAAGSGGGVLQFNSIFDSPNTISGSIFAGNTATGSGPDLVKDPQSETTANYSLLGTAVAPTAGGNNVSTNNPQLAPLANNGGPTATHEPLPGSPAIDAGDPAITFDPAEFDQRGAPFVRIADGDGAGGARIDIGAIEFQTAVGASADFDSDSDVDGADFLRWQRGVGAAGAAATRAIGNADNDADVDGADLGVWKAQFGQPQSALTAAASSATAEMAALDAVYAAGDFTGLFASGESWWRRGRGWRR